MSDKKCVDCRWFQYSRTLPGSIQYANCVCPKQQGWKDREGAESYEWASLIRRFQCHGNWWEAPAPAVEEASIVEEAAFLTGAEALRPRGLHRLICWLRWRFGLRELLR